MRKIICIVTVCFMIITMFSGCSVLQKLGLQDKEDEELAPVSSIVMNEDEAKKLSDKLPIYLYFLTADSSKLKLEVRYIPVSEAKKSSQNLASIIVKELIKGPSSNTGLKPSVPAGTSLRSVTINGGVATVDFSKEFVDKHPGGKTAEQLTLYSVVNSLTELKDVQKVKFIINGKQQAEFKGNFKIDVPYPRNPALISKEVPAPSTGTENTNDTKKQDTGKTKPAETKPTDTKQQTTTKPQTTTNPQDTKGNTTKDNSAKPTSGEVTEAPGISGEDAEATYLENLE